MTARTTWVSNPVRYPCLRTLVSVCYRKLFAPIDRPYDFNKFHLYTISTVFPQQTQSLPVLSIPFRATRNFYTKLNKPPTCALHPVLMSNTRPLRFTAAAGTKLAGPSSWPLVKYRKITTEFYNLCLPHSRDIAGSSFRLLSKIPHCCLNKSSEPYLFRCDCKSSQTSQGSQAC